MSVVPANAFRSRGVVGGPFNPESKVFLLYNTGVSAWDWRVRTSDSWLAASPREGRLEPGTRASILVSVAHAPAAALEVGLHRATVDFQNVENQESVSRTVELAIRQPQALRVLPSADMAWTAIRDGESELEESSFVVTNVGPQEIHWQARTTADWLRSSPDEGSLQPGDRTKISVRAESIDELPLGFHRARLDLLNLTDGIGDTSREARLLLRGANGLAVMPQADLVVAVDPESFPALQTCGGFALHNQGTEAIQWEARPSEEWLVVTPEEGELTPGAEDVVTIIIDPEKRPKGRAAVAFVNRTDGVGTTSRWVELTAQENGDESHDTPERRRERLSQFGITWTMDRPYEAGRFANGDWWVVGPVQLIAIDPPSWTSRGRTRNGSMVNPSPRSGYKQAYDSACYGKYAEKDSFVPRWNAAGDLSGAQPLLLRAHTSLISTISDPIPGARPQIDSAAVLTVLNAAPPEGSFRPPYCGDDKSIRFNKSQIDWSLLDKLAPAATTPSWSEVERWFERPWIDHVPIWVGRYIHPTKNMPDYGREICDRVSTAALMVHLDVPDARKETLLVRFLQLGIDLFGIVQEGGFWPPSGGHMSGRKWPILFAGLMFGEPTMSGIGSDPGVQFAEDGQTFFVQETKPGVYNRGFGGYGPQHVGLPEWGQEHSLDPSSDDVDWWGDGYRLCCTANAWWGQLLAAYIMGVKPLWNHDALFDYQDRYLRENLARGVHDWRLAWRDFYLDMWKAYRPNY